MELIHIAVTLILSMCAAIWGVAKYTAGKYQHSLEEMDSRLKTVEREYITRTSVEQTLSRIELNFSQALQRLHVRLDDMYRDLHTLSVPPLGKHRAPD